MGIDIATELFRVNAGVHLELQGPVCNYIVQDIFMKGYWALLEVLRRKLFHGLSLPEELLRG